MVSFPCMPLVQPQECRAEVCVVAARLGLRHFYLRPSHNETLTPKWIWEKNALYLGQLTAEMSEKVNVVVCEMRELSRDLWGDSFPAGQSLHPGWAIPNKMARADLNQQSFSSHPQHPIEVWFVVLTCLFARKHRLQSVQLECWLAGQGTLPHSSSVPPCSSEVPHNPGARLDTHCSHCISSPGATLTKLDSWQQSTAMFCQCPANKALPIPIKIPIGFSQATEERHTKEWCSARFAPCSQLPSLHDRMLTFSLPLLPSKIIS